MLKASLLVLSLFAAALLPCAAGDEAPPKLPLGKDTTYVTGPLDKRGYIDYEAALNAELSRGVTPKNNANVLLLEALGPAPEGGNGMSADYYRWLDVPPPPRDGEYFVSIGTLGRQKLALTNDQLQALFEEQSRAANRPWAAKDYAIVAEWLKQNERPIGLVTEAVKRPVYFNPLVSNRKPDEPSNLIGGLLPTVQKCRELATALNARAMLRLHEGKLDDAWADLLTCHRLARLVARGGTLIESLVGVAIGQLAHNATLVYIDRAKLTAKQAADRVSDVRALPEWPPFANKIALTERMMGLDALQNIRRQDGAPYLISELFGLDRKFTDEELKRLAQVDWTACMRAMNGWYDRVAVAMAVPDRADREKEFDKLEQDLRDRVKAVGSVEDLLKLLVAQGGPDKSVGERIGNVLLNSLSPALRKVQSARDRAEQAGRNLEVAFALAACFAETGRYPEKLDDLAPKHLARVPSDLFSGKSLRYKPEAKGYLFYSVGPNGKDEDGRTYDDDPPGDDPRVRMPVPPLKPAK